MVDEFHYKQSYAEAQKAYHEYMLTHVSPGHQGMKQVDRSDCVPPQARGSIFLSSGDEAGSASTSSTTSESSVDSLASTIFNLEAYNPLESNLDTFGQPVQDYGLNPSNHYGE